MTPLYTQEEFDNAKGCDKLPCKCKYCKETFFRYKYIIKAALNPKNKQTNDYCSRNCQYQSQFKHETIRCDNCNIEIKKLISTTKRHKNHFCSHSCSTKYFNAHKTTGIRRSKLEIWLESQLTFLYPSLEIHYNKKDAIGSELDIYVPSLKIAFELNGIFHYEPIYGNNKLDQIKNNDSRKYKSCIDLNISLCIIDSSQLKYFKEKNCKKYLDIIINIINNTMNTGQ